jgi:hypothetical protein
MKKQVWLPLVLLWLPAASSAQAVTSVGARVRVSTSEERPTAGLLLAVSGDSLLIGFSNRQLTPVALARSDLTSLQMSLGGDGKRGAALGAQLGMIAGAIGFGVEHLMSRSSDPRFHYDNGDLGYAAGSGAVWGLLAGAVMGAIVAEERWGDATLPPSIETLPASGERPALQTQTRLRLFPEGGRIRVRTQEGQQIQGRYEGQTTDVLRIIGDSRDLHSPHLVPIARIVEISERRSMTGPWLRRGTWLGAVLGVTTTVVVAAQTTEEECPPDSCLSPWGFIPVSAVFGALTGGAVGAILGSHVKGWRTQKW